MNTAFFDCAAGASGDMILAALIDCGADRDKLLHLPNKLGLEAKIKIAETNRGGFRGTRVIVTIGKDQTERRLAEIEKLLSQTGLPAGVEKNAINTFRILAAAEARAHGCAPEEVHFHETGAADAIIDIVGACLLIDDLAIARIYASPLPMPGGTTDCAHGTIPLPAPALAGILQGVRVYGVERDTECVTPTGAAILKSMAEAFGPMPEMTITACGHGAGSRELSGTLPNLLRLFFGKSGGETDEVEVIACNIDDMTPELAGGLGQALLAAGALDVTMTPAVMKKGRPGLIIEVIARLRDAEKIKEMIFRESSTIGLRYQRMQRQTLVRKCGSVATAIGRVRVKKVLRPDGESLSPEYDDCIRIANETGLTLVRIYQEVDRADIATFREE